MNILFYYYCSIHTILLLLLLFYCYYINYVCLINILAKIQLLIISLDFGQLLTMFSEIAGAFYPNYFIKNTFDMENEFNERMGIKLLGGLDPSRTVYLSGWPSKQPGLLYARRIQDIFKQNLTSVGRVIVSFNDSSRVYIQFVEEKFEKQNQNTKQISPFVYKAIKMRQSNIPIEVPLLNDDMALRRADEMNLYKQHFLTPTVVIKDNVKPELPSLRVSRIPLIIRNVCIFNVTTEY